MKKLVIGLAALWLTAAPAQSVFAGGFGFGIELGTWGASSAEGDPGVGYWGAPAWIDAFAHQEGVESYPILAASFAYVRERQAMAQGSWEDIERANAGDERGP